MRTVFRQFRSLDFTAGQKPTHMVAISKYAAAKLQRAYGRKPVAIVYPPVDVNSYLCDASPEDYFLVVSRLIAYKRIDIVIEAFNRLKTPLKIIGTGAELASLRRVSGPNIEFLGAIGESELRYYYARCRALIFPGEEDFGLPPLEAHASGRPVIAFGRGGAQETVVGDDAAASKDATGVFFYEQTANAIVEAVHKFERLSFDRDRIRSRAMLFDTTQFQSQIRLLLQQAHNGTLAPGMWAEPHLESLHTPDMYHTSL